MSRFLVVPLALILSACAAPAAVSRNHAPDSGPSRVRYVSLFDSAPAQAEPPSDTLVSAPAADPVPGTFETVAAGDVDDWPALDAVVATVALEAEPEPVLGAPVVTEPDPPPVIRRRYELTSEDTLRSAFSRWAERDNCDLLWRARIDYPVLLGVVFDAPNFPAAVALALHAVAGARQPLLAHQGPQGARDTGAPDPSCLVVVSQP
jgi:hypothetical protein